MNLNEYRSSSAEKERTADLLRLMPASGSTALDIGARDGHFSLLLAERFEKVFALDLTKPAITHPKVECVRGDAAALEFPNRSFDFVFCAEVLEHIPPPALSKVCGEIERVTNGQILIGVPYKQDIRVGRTTCYSCMGKNPPWGHVNSFDERRLESLFPACVLKTISFVGTNSEQTNAVSAALMDIAGNPYGTYAQDEPCIHCGKALEPPPERTAAKKVLTRLAFWSQHATGVFSKPRGNWMHVLLSRRDGV
ncbi:MAG TPA: class I SAM-dependent methyltransferase [Pyrinomonadaceae bacterium]|jgi:cyclopropane fatty-acyl-phospholipid synthase-like methyltransferase|nr:class I SAM-dependent methyltransferase [Pyrinomonadaceae bacterium]